MDKGRKLMITAAIMASLAPAMAQNEINKDSVPNTKEV